MTISYKLWKGPFETTAKVVIKTDGTLKTSIPIDEANTDYQEYLEWAKTNTPEEAD
tara:strand:- start:177 stop:344 length:168 start_codon:yes stop_codon:yes gene_type:complete